MNRIKAIQKSLAFKAIWYLTNRVSNDFAIYAGYLAAGRALCENMTLKDVELAFGEKHVDAAILIDSLGHEEKRVGIPAAGLDEKLKRKKPNHKEN